MSRFNVGGTSQWLYQLSKGLDEREHTNLLLVGECPEGEREDLRLSEIRHKKIPGLGPKTSILQIIEAFFALRREIKVFDPDIINTHTSKAGLIGRLAGATVQSKGKIVHTYHGHVLQGYFNLLLQKIIRAVEISLSFITDFFLVSGEQVLRDLHNAGIIRKKPTQTIWPAVPDIKLGDRAQLRKSLEIPSSAIVFGWLGRKVPIKRIDRIIELAKARPHIYFIIAGDGKLAKEIYPEMFLDGELSNLLELGFTSPSEIWAVADVCLLTSDNEAMPISPIEAALCKKPVIATDAGSTREVVIHEKTGYVCSKSSNELLNYVDSLASDSDFRERLGEEARTFALKRFSLESSISRQIAGYQQALTI